MANVIGPLLSLGARKSVGGALTFANWKGLNTVRIKSTPSNPKTINQMKGRAYFAAGGKVTKRSDTNGDTAMYLKSKTPAQQSWASYFVREMMGTNNANIEAAKTAYGVAGNSTIKGFFDDAAAQVGIESVDLDGTANTQVAAGLALWAAYAAAYRLGDPAAPAAVTSVTEPQVFAFTESLTGQLPT